MNQFSILISILLWSVLTDDMMLVNGADKKHLLRDALTLGAQIVEDIDKAQKKINQSQVMKAYNLIKDDLDWFDYVGVPNLKYHMKATHQGVVRMQRHLYKLKEIPEIFQEPLEELSDPNKSGVELLQDLVGGLKKAVNILSGFVEPLKMEQKEFNAHIDEFTAKYGLLDQKTGQCNEYIVDQIQGLSSPPKHFTSFAGDNDKTDKFEDERVNPNYYVQTLRIDGGGWVVDSIQSRVCQISQGKEKDCKWLQRNGNPSELRPSMYKIRGTGFIQDVVAPPGGCISQIEGYYDSQYLNQISVTTVKANGSFHQKVTSGGLNFVSGRSVPFAHSFDGGCLLSLEGYTDDYINQLGFIYGMRFDSSIDTIDRWKNNQKHVVRLTSNSMRALRIYDTINKEVMSSYYDVIYKTSKYHFQLQIIEEQLNDNITLMDPDDPEGTDEYAREDTTAQAQECIEANKSLIDKLNTNIESLSKIHNYDLKEDLKDEHLRHWNPRELQLQMEFDLLESELQNLLPIKGKTYDQCHSMIGYIYK